MARLTWHSAAAQHGQALQQFVCTDPPRRSYEKNRGPHHPRPWELQVQSHLRGLKVPVAQGSALLLGYDQTRLATAIHFGFDDTGTQFMIWAVARGFAFAGQGYGRRALDRAMASLRSTKTVHGLDCGVITHIDPRNDASRAMFKSAGFEYLRQADGYEAWINEV